MCIRDRFLAGDWWGKEVYSAPFWIEIVGAQGAIAWAAAEAWRYSRQLAKRADLGLAEPELANRALLWCGFGVAQLTLVAFVVLATWLFAETGRIFVGVDMSIAGSGLASAVCLWLAFWPPVAYRRWVAGAAS